MSRYPRSFRLLEFAPGHEDSHLVSLTINRAHDRSHKACPGYIALSYVWGDANQRVPILLNGRSLSVTSNLYETLIYIRDVAAEAFLWVEALCINQSDPIELTH